jgi:hypothetical protein
MGFGILVVVNIMATVILNVTSYRLKYGYQVLRGKYYFRLQGRNGRSKDISM